MTTPKPPPPHAAALVSRALRALGLRQIDLAQRVGVTPVTVSRWLTGRTRPDLAQAAAVAATLAEPALDRLTIWTTPAHEPLPAIGSTP